MGSRLLHHGLHQAVQASAHTHHNSIRPMRRLLGLWNVQVPPPPELTLKALLEFAGPTSEGELVRAVAVPWFEIARMIQRDPQAMYEIDPRVWEEIIAGAYTRAGFDDVILTPRSGDFGRDVVVTKRGVGSIRIFDQVKAYTPGHVVTAEEVRAMIGVITGALNVSKGVVTTTSTFAPRLLDDPYISPLVPYRLELKPRDVLLPWLDELSG
jgi:restriction system protein